MCEVGFDPEISEECPLSELLEDTPPGPELARLLAGVDRASLSAADLLRLAAARQRLIAHQEAQLLADLHTIGKLPPDDEVPDPPPGGEPERWEWAQVEAAFALRWTSLRAYRQLELADQLIDRLPMVFASLLAGDIDVPKARLIAELLSCLSDQLAAAVAGKVIDQAREQTTGQLRARLRRLLLAADPQAAARRAQQAVKQRRVVSYTDDETQLASLAGYELAPHRVAAVMERLDAVAKAAKAAGDDRSLDQLRADCFLDLLCGQGVALGGHITDGDLGSPHTTGSPPGQADDEPAHTPWPDQPPHPDPDFDPDFDSGPDTGFHAGPDPGAGLSPDLAAGVSPHSSDPPWAFGVGGTYPIDPAEDDDPAYPDEQHEADRRWLDRFERLPTIRPATHCLLCGHLDGEPPAPGPLPAPRPGVVEITLTLDTLHGRTDAPAELTGHGPIPAGIARHILTTLLPPPGQPQPQTQTRTQARLSVYDRMRRLSWHGTASGGHTRDSADPRPPPEPPGSGATRQRSHTTNRRPNPALAAFVRARDRTCVAPGCRRTARRCDIDHNHDWVDGGETLDRNLSLLCRTHHRFKHAAGSRLEQTSPGVFAWTTPAGRHYRTTSDHPISTHPAMDSSA